MVETKNKIYNNQNLVEFIDALKGNIDLILPLYQRDVSWSEELRKSFLKKIDKDKTFLNSIVLVKKCDNSLKFEVVDGQQRLLSLLINDESDLQKPLEIQINSYRLRLIREFDEFLDIEPIQITCNIRRLENAYFNWIVYDNEPSGEQLFQSINIDTRKLSVFDEFIGRAFQADTNSEKFKFVKALKNAVARDQLGYDYDPCQLKDFTDKISVPFDPVDFDWTLRLLLGHCVSFTFPKAKFNNIKMQNIVNDNLRKELKTAQPNVIESIRENLAKVTDAITQNRLFLSRRHAKSCCQDTNFVIDKFREFRLLQIYLMSYDTWLPTDKCRDLFKLYLENPDNPKAITFVIQNLDLSKNFKNKTKYFDRKDLFLGDWLLFYALNFLGDEDKTIFIKAAKDIQVSNGTSAEIFEQIFKEMKEQYSIKKFKFPRYSGEIEHFVAQRNSSSSIDETLINSYANLCLIPNGINQSLRDQQISQKAKIICKQNSESKEIFLPKLTFTALAVTKLKNDEERILNVLNDFWLHFTKEMQYKLKSMDN